MSEYSADRPIVGPVLAPLSEKAAEEGSYGN
jgi:hypothetical protein